jgi:release factor glutamine methyltransferase
LRDSLLFSAATSRGEALVRIAEIFRRSGIDEADREALLTLGAACRVSRATMITAPEAALADAASRLANFAARRAAGEPLSRIVGTREFWTLELTIAPQTLDPRPETEALVEAALARFHERRTDRLQILDLGVGSGALLCALLTEFVNACGMGVDISAPAVEVARGNIEECGLAPRAEVRVGNWTEGLKGLFDLVISNPPYVRSVDIARLPPEVRDFDPRIALDGGPDGLDAYRAILPPSFHLLGTGGWLMVEVGASQAPAVLTIAADAGLISCATAMDLAGVERVVAGRSPRLV